MQTRFEDWATLSNGNHMRTLMMVDVHYTVVTVMDPTYRTVYWYDTDHNREEFRYEICGYKKSGEPEWKCIVVNSNIKLVVNEVQYHTQAAYDEAFRKDMVTP